MKNPEERKAIIQGNLGNVRALVVNPSDGVMYWTVWQFSEHSPGAEGRIETAWMDGSKRANFVTGHLHWPNGLTLDLKEKHLYWCDGYFNKIERVNLDGTRREVVIFFI